MESAQFYVNILNQLQDGIYYVNQDRKILFWNHGAEKITGYTAEEIIGQECPRTQLNHIDIKGRPLCTMGCPLYETLVDGKQRKEQVFVRHKEGHRIPLWVNVFPIVEHEQIIGAVEVFTQNSPRVFEDNLVDHLTEIAMYDELTKLPNRRYLESQLEFRILEFKKFGKLFGLLFADLDNFSQFNNELGHDLGDAVLKNVSKSMRLSVQRRDLIGRWGGEEFIGIYSLSKARDCETIAERFRLLVENTLIKGENGYVHSTASIGMTVVQQDDTIESIVKRADMLMYASKRNGKNRVTTDI